MDILIKGIKKLPEDGDYIHLIIQNGKVHTAISCGYLTTDKLNVGKAIALPPHGRLIDADELLASDAINWGEEAWNGINHAPVVLEENYE